MLELVTGIVLVDGTDEQSISCKRRRGLDRRRISVLTKERDGYKALAEAREEQLNAIRLQNIHTE